MFRNCRCRGSCSSEGPGVASRVDTNGFEPAVSLLLERLSIVALSVVRAFGSTVAAAKYDFDPSNVEDLTAQPLRDEMS